MRKSSLLFCTFVILGVLVFALIAKQEMLNISDGQSTHLVYSTDFENVVKVTDTNLNMSIPNYFDFTGDNASMWVEGLDRHTPGMTSHSGNRSIGIEVINGYRAEFNLLDLQNIVGKDYSVSVWLYLPKDWALHLADDNNPDWYAICDTFMASAQATPTPFYPYNEVYISQANIGENPPDFNLESDIRDNTGSGLSITPLGGNVTNLNHFPLPLGQWFNLKYYVERSVLNGVVKIWVNDVLIANQNGVKTESANNKDFFTTIGKIYHDSNDTYEGYKIWVDDLQIYNGLPPSSESAHNSSDRISKMTVLDILAVIAVTTVIGFLVSKKLKHRSAAIR